MFYVGEGLISKSPVEITACARIRINPDETVMHFYPWYDNHHKSMHVVFVTVSNCHYTMSSLIYVESNRDKRWLSAHKMLQYFVLGHIRNPRQNDNVSGDVSRVMT